MHGTADALWGKNPGIIRSPGSWFEDSNMLYAKSLRVIGQWLETASVTTFELEKCGNYYVVWTDYLTEAGQWDFAKCSGQP